MNSAKEIIETFWRIQDEGDYTKVVDLFAEDAVLVDPFFGTFEGKAAIGEFMKKMNAEMGARQTSFVVREIDGGGKPRHFPNAADQDCVNFIAGKDCKILDDDGNCIFRHTGLVKGSDPEAIRKRHDKLKS